MKTALFKQYAVKVLISLLLTLPAVACSNLLPAIQQNVTKAHDISTQAMDIIAADQAYINSLPADDPAKPALQKSLDATKAVKAKADAYVASAQGVINSLQSGTLDGATSSLIGSLPYGSYVIGVLGIVGAVMKNNKAKSVLDDFTNLAEAWHTVGPPLSAIDDETAYDVMGPKAAAAVLALAPTGPSTNVSTDIPA